MRRIAGRILDWVVVASGALILLGAVLISRAANAGTLEHGLLSPPYLPLYAGILLVAYLLLASADRSRGALRAELPSGYGVVGLGLLLFALGLIGDVAWSAAFGSTTDASALFTPTHLVAFAGIALILSAPLRAPVRHGGRHWIDRMPGAIALGLLLGFGGFLTQFANPVVQVTPRERVSDDLLRARGELWSMRPDGTRQTRLTLRSQENVNGASWAPSGALSAHTTWEHLGGRDPGDPASVTTVVEIDDAAGRPLHTIRDGSPAWLTGAVWSPDGRTLALTVNHPAVSQASAQPQAPATTGPIANLPPLPVGGAANPGWQWDIALAPSDGSAVPRILEATSATDVVSDWAPDGGSLLGHSDRSGNYEVYRIDPVSDTWTDLTNDPAVDDWPAWAPDGRQIVFSSNRGPGGYHLWVMDQDGSNPRQLTHGNGSDWMPAWSPDGRSIAFISNRDGNQEVYLVSADGGTETNLTRTPESDEWISADAWTPDGSLIILTSAPIASGENPLALPIGAAGIILLSVVLAALLLVAIRVDRFTAGSVTVVLTVGIAIVAGISDEYEFIAAAAVAGLATDLLVAWLRRSRPAWLERALTFAAPALFMVAYFVALALTGTLGWTIPLVISGVALAGTSGLVVSLLAGAGTQAAPVQVGESVEAGTQPPA